MKKIMLVVILLIVAFYSYQYFQAKGDIDSNASAGVSSSAMNIADVDSIAPTYVDDEAIQPVAPSFSCDDRQHCSQMTSCAEATYFIQQCPNTQMDGNNDGVPCEQQWCH